MADKSRTSETRKRAVRSMLTHDEVWSALDRLAARAGLTASALARKSGLDPTTFNKSKRFTADDRPRWPSTESLAKALDATATPIEEFVSLVSGRSVVARGVPLAALSEASDAHFDATGHPLGKGWSEIAFPATDDKHIYALAISGNALLPVYRDGDVIVISPAASIGRGSRVVVRTRSDLLVKEVKRRSVKAVVLQSLARGEPDMTLPASDVQWIARIIWASQ